MSYSNVIERTARIVPWKSNAAALFMITSIIAALAIYMIWPRDTDLNIAIIASAMPVFLIMEQMARFREHIDLFEGKINQSTSLVNPGGKWLLTSISLVALGHVAIATLDLLNLETQLSLMILTAIAIGIITLIWLSRRNHLLRKCSCRARAVHRAFTDRCGLCLGKLF